MINDLNFISNIFSEHYRIHLASENLKLKSGSNCTWLAICPLSILRRGKILLEFLLSSRHEKHEGCVTKETFPASLQPPLDVGIPGSGDLITFLTANHKAAPPAPPSGHRHVIKQPLSDVQLCGSVLKVSSRRTRGRVAV